MDILIDAGNTRLKWAMDDDTHISELPVNAIAYGDDTPEQCLEALLREQKPQAMVIVHVQGEAFTQSLHALAKRLALPITVVDNLHHYGDIVIGYGDPSRLGADRLVAMLAAFKQYKDLNKPLLVIDAGTAVTADVVIPSGEHLGGVIVPGFMLWRQALTHNTKQISFQADTETGDSCFAKNTKQAVFAGASVGLPGALDAIIVNISQQLHTDYRYDELIIVITGGDGAEIAERLQASVTVSPSLVLLGLHYINQDIKSA